MKKFSLILSLFLFIFNYSTYAQRGFKSKEEVQRMIWSRKDVAKTIKSTPEQSKDQSAVILYQKNYFNYKKRDKRAFKEHYFRRRILILDKAALEEYSDFKYDNEKYKNYYGNQGTFKIKGQNYFNIKIVKPNGKEIKIDLKKYTVEEDKEKKLAIPNLEIGDIVDYYYYNYVQFKAPYGFDFSPFQSDLVHDYPIIKYDFEINMKKGFYFNFLNQNGAPDFKKIRTSDPKQYRYFLSMENIKPRKSKHWVFPLLAYPSIKFQVYLAPGLQAKKHTDGFLSEKSGVVKKSVSKEDVLKRYSNVGMVTYYKGAGKKFIKSNKEKEKIQEFYEFLRFHTFNKYIPVLTAYNKNKYIVYSVKGAHYDLNNPMEFINIMAGFLKKNKIKYEIVLVKKRPYGKIEDLILKKNLKPLIKVNLKSGETMYLQPIIFEPFHTIAGEINPLFEGNTAYSLKLGKNNRPSNISKITLPISDVKDNTIVSDIDISFKENDLNKITYTKKISATGHEKDIREIYVEPYQFADNDSKKYKAQDITAYTAGKKNKLEAKKRYQGILTKKAKKHKEALKDFIEERFEFKIDNYDFGIDNFGRYHNQPVFKMHESFDVKDGMIKKAGRNIILLAGKVIGKQIHIDKKEMKRTEDIYKISNSTTKYNITIHIPDGYTVKGLDHFNKSVVNETGKFISKAEQKDGKIEIHIEETYFKIFEPNANWKKLVDILNTSYQFNQEKLLFKK